MNINKIRYGDQGLLPVKHHLRAGTLQMQLMEDGSLRYIKFNNKLILQSIYCALRDENWGTVPIDISHFNITENNQSFRVDFHAVHHTDRVHFEWDGAISGTSGGSFHYEMAGTVGEGFLKNRLGFCILHPLEIAGTPVQVETDSGMISDCFAKLITPYDPFTHMSAMKFKQDDMEIGIQFTGDLFHTEDQRNWTDASYKTFCTPLDIPYPVRLASGEGINQSVAVDINAPKLITELKSDDSLVMTVSANTGQMLPKLGTWFSGIAQSTGDEEIELLRALNLAQLRVQLNLLQQDWKKRFDDANNLSDKLNIELEVEVLTDIEELRIQQLIAYISTQPIRVCRLSFFPASYNEDYKVETNCELNGSSYYASQLATKLPMIETARKWTKRYGLKIALGGGSRTNFTEFNRVILPFNLMDYAEYGLQPQTHAFDIASIIETLEVQNLTVKTAQSILAETRLPLRINSVTFKPRFNPYAASVEGTVIPRSAQTDTRQHSLFGAGWTIGSLHQLAAAGVDSINYYEHNGELGLLSESGGTLTPIYLVLKEIGEFAGAEMLPIVFNTPRKAEGIALLKGRQIRIILANLENNAQTIRIAFSGIEASEYRLKAVDETNLNELLNKNNPFRFSAAVQFSHQDHLEISLKPFAICILDFNHMNNSI